MANKKYWQSFSEFNESEQHRKLAADEFKEDLPIVDPATAGKEIDTLGATRRDFLKYLGFSTAAAALAASCETPVRKAVPFLNKPQDIVPGIADYYATTFVSEGEAIPVVAKVRDGRPIKVDGNTLSGLTKAGTSARVQASVLDLYDTSRQRFPMANSSAVTWEQLDKQLGTALSAAGPVVILTGTVNSPTTKQIIGEFLSKYPGSRHVQYDGISYSGMLLANEATYGKRTLPLYRFENAKVIVSLGADFLGTWLNPVVFQRGYTANRKVTDSNLEMSKHYQFESMLSMTGANADERFTHKPSESGAVALALLNAVNTGTASGVSNPKLKAGLEKAAASLKAAGGNALVVSRSNNANVQIIVNAINEAIGANGKTIDWSVNQLTKQGLDSEFAALIADMESGRVGSIIIHDVNPVHNHFEGKRFAEALKKLRVSVAISYKQDETAELCKYIAPVHHYLESWGDTEAVTGYISLLQPTISPLFSTRQFQDSLLKWSGNTSTYETYFRNYWTSKLGSLDNYNKALQDGVVETASSAPASTAFNGAAVATATTALSSAPKGGSTEVILYENVAVGDGRYANNPWLQELPDAITRATWDNYAIVSPKFAKEVLNIDIANQRDADEYEVNTEKPLLSLEFNGKTIELPAIIIPGTNDDTVAVALGYGRSSASGKDEDTAQKIGRAVLGAGKNAIFFTTYNGSTIIRSAPSAKVSKASGTYKVAQTQTHNSYEGRHNVIQEVTLDEIKKNPTIIRDERAKELEPWGGLEKFEAAGTLYPVYDRPGAKWGMSIDLNACYGCGACVIACHAENNVPVVGKNEVLRYHDMHWLRIDRYFSGDVHDADSVQTVFQPMLCQHCDNAPCENVCPVAATSHSSEGINQMVYNRCIGTRYCANNCPYKVRRFNWADYTGADSFSDNQKKSGVGALNEAVFQMNDDLTRMVLNPDVTVRSRGVMEKCSFCVQRQQEGKLKAKRENRKLQDSDTYVACANACPADAIVFGNVNDASSTINKVRGEGKNRIFFSLEQIHTLPSVSYMAKVRNSPTAGDAKHEEAAHEVPSANGEHH
ncbi:MAG: TAT-variant-translocated molybdopterin oxidoreductase [Chitinophagaceae bacterium]|nr:TAT-variant-translocated molybdopterin oxidoreductase [Chitinophagaceae bacterium]